MEILEKYTFFDIFRSVMSPNYSKWNMKHAFICNSIPSSDIFLHGHAEKSNPTVFSLSRFFVCGLSLFLLFLPFCYSCYLFTGLLVQEFFKKALSKQEILTKWWRGKLSSKFFTQVSKCFCSYLKANHSVWVLYYFGFSSSNRSFIIIRGALFM